MSSINLKHSGGNGVAIAAPSSNPASNRTLVLPSTTGSAGQVLKVASANHSSTNAELEFGTTGSGSSLQVLEQFYGIADGRSFSTSNGTVSTTNVTAYQSLSNSFAEVNGSSLTYQPPTGTTELIYTFELAMRENGSNDRFLTSTYVEIDSTEILESRNSIYATSEYQNSIVIQYGFRIGTGGDNATTGDRGSWTGNKTIRVMACRYNDTYAADLHRLGYYQGSLIDVVRRPYVGITAIGVPS
jgi:hypothetical protein